MVYPITPRGSEFTFTYRDAQTVSRALNDNAGWNGKTLVIADTTAQKGVPFKHDPRTGAFTFGLTRGRYYRSSEGS